jgi:UDP-N-acetylglucosamine acyltransferase
MPKTHPTALVDPAAHLAEDVEIGPFTIVGPRVRIGAGTAVGAHCIIENLTTLGSGNKIGHHVCLGSRPQDLKFHGEEATCTIGDNNDIRENVTVHLGTENGGNDTSIGNGNLLMVGSHIAHDCHVRNRCIFANNVMLAGHVVVNDHAVISGGTAVSHYVTIGRHAFLGGLAGVVHDCPPFMVSDGHPNRCRGVNLIGLTRHGFTPDTLDALKRAYRALYGKRTERTGNPVDLLEELTAEHGHNPVALEFLDFFRRTTAAPNGRFAESERKDNKRASRV